MLNDTIFQEDRSGDGVKDEESDESEEEIKVKPASRSKRADERNRIKDEPMQMQPPLSKVKDEKTPQKA
jgi:hypothetical protein